MNVVSASSRRRHHAAARWFALAASVVALVLMGVAASHSPAGAAETASADVAQAVSHEGHMVAAGGHAALNSLSQPFAPTCETCAENHEGVLVACALTIAMAIVVFWRSPRVVMWSSRTPMPPRAVHFVMPPRVLAPDLYALSISRT